ncbi:MAG: hypothetical protein CMJ44_17985 [Pimelobacter sp.]|nr:hypothetical protein [Pimelobacter sp.]
MPGVRGGNSVHVHRPLVTHAAHPDGTLLRREAIACGINDKALARLVDGKVLIKLRQGVYCLWEVFIAASPAQRHILLARAVLRLYGEHVALCDATSCLTQGGPDFGLDLSSVHLAHLSGGGRRRSRIVHHSGSLLVDDLRKHEGRWLTTPARSVAGVVCTDGVVAGLVQANHFLHREEMSRGQLVQMVQRSVNWPGSLGHHIVLQLADERIESVGETRCDHLFFSQGLPRPTLQHPVYDPERGVTYRVDFAWPDHRVIVEFDGQEKYHRLRREGETIEQAVMREKWREDRIRELTGWTVIRITWSDLNFPVHTASRVRSAFSLASAPPLGLASGL